MLGSKLSLGGQSKPLAKEAVRSDVVPPSVRTHSPGRSWVRWGGRLAHGASGANRAVRGSSKAGGSPSCRPQEQALGPSELSSLSGLSPVEVEQRLGALLALLPDLAPSTADLVARVKPSLLWQLAEDPHRLAQRILWLREQYPAANVSAMVAQRPAMMVEPGWEGVLEGAQKLQAMFPEVRLDSLVASQPLLLVPEVDELIGEMERLMPGVDAWLCLQRNPGLVLAVQQGQQRLGPGAEQ
ncbi:hypothetical protein QJQ45_029808 [Haematococcus lacustris]|nr:hypothetical protein QJQ45_029808 [Haematococcus lacustris]